MGDRFYTLKQHACEDKTIIEVLNEIGPSSRVFEIAHAFDIDNLKRRDVKTLMYKTLRQNYDVEQIAIIGIDSRCVKLIITFGNVQDELDLAAHLNPRVSIDSLNVLNIIATEKNIDGNSVTLKALLEWE